MPVRKKEIFSAKIEYSYDELLIHIRQEIDGKYGGLSKFIKSDNFSKFGFIESDTEKARLMSVLSLPKIGTRKKVRSFPIIKKLYENILGVKLENSVRVTRKQVILSMTKMNIK